MVFSPDCRLIMVLTRSGVFKINYKEKILILPIFSLVRHNSSGEINNSSTPYGFKVFVANLIFFYWNIVWYIPLYKLVKLTSVNNIYWSGKTKINAFSTAGGVAVDQGWALFNWWEDWSDEKSWELMVWK